MTSAQVVRPTAFTLLVCLCLPTTIAAAEQGWSDLLENGLKAWRGYQTEEPPTEWQVDSQSVLSLNGQGGDLLTRDQYGDFDLRFDWKISKGGNSGVIYRVTEEEPQPYKTGPEYQVFDDAVADKSDPSVLSAAIYALYKNEGGEPKPAGEWNSGRIVIDNGGIEHWLNGELVCEAQLGSDDWNERVANSKFDAWKSFGRNRRGHIALQDHGAKVWYRNVRVRRLNEPPPSAASPKRLLFVTQSAGFRHSTVTRKPHELSHSERIMQQLGVRSGAFRVDCTQDVERDFTPELLENYDAVAFYTTGKLPIPEETLTWFLDTWLAEEGHGFLGVHSAADTYKDYEPFWDMIGGTFNGHPWTADTNVVLKLHESDHPAAAPWGSAGGRIAITDEIYQFKHWQPDKVRVLMSLDMERTELKKPYHVPVLWVKDYGAGRVMHMSLGHREDVWERPAYQESLIAGIRWILGELPGDATPNPQLSAVEDRAAEQAAEAAAAGG